MQEVRYLARLALGFELRNKYYARSIFIVPLTKGSTYTLYAYYTSRIIFAGKKTRFSGFTKKHESFLPKLKKNTTRLDGLTDKKRVVCTA
jgi:hypothetical protein